MSKNSRVSVVSPARSGIRVMKSRSIITPFLGLLTSYVRMIPTCQHKPDIQICSCKVSLDGEDVLTGL